ncbi:MAG: ABC transporter ATP-binding protein, partial [Lachnospiraceae bacterium]|nr:ABC transporter ATP-binding protein [Lachnospiraceae bacterium]
MLKYLKKYWYFAVLAAIFMMGEVLIDLYQPRMMERIVDEGILGLSNNGVSDIDLIISTGIRMILIVAAGGACGILSGVCTNVCGQNFGNDLRKASFRNIMHFSFEQTDDFTTGSLITRTTGDVTQVQNMVQQLIRGFVRCMMFFIGGSTALLSLDMNFSIIIAIALPVIILEILFIVWRTNPLFMLVQKKIDKMNSVIQEDIAGARVVKAFVQEDKEAERFQKHNKDLSDTQFKVLILMAYMAPVMNIVLNLAVVGIIYIGGIQVQAGAMAPGKVMAAITYISQILNGMMMLAMIFQTISRGTTSAKRINEVLRSEPAIRDGKGADGQVTADSANAIEFKNVSFTYPGSKANVLHDIDLRIKKGEMLAVIGATGCGKSTFVNMIDRFYDATSGEVLIDGVPIKDYKLDKLRDKIAFVLQKSELFSTTIRENIMIGKPGATEDELKEAARAAQADDFIMQQPEGYDTAVAQS